MSEELFDVAFFGILQAGKDRETVMQNMATLFNTDAAKLAPYFTGDRKVIKGRINASSAEKYKAALENVGLVINIEPCQIEQDGVATEVSPSQHHKQAADTSGISLAPTGANVIENPIAVRPQEIGDISAITMAEIGADVIENPVEIVAQKIEDISSITMAPAGSDVLEHSQPVTAQKIGDISAITLAEAGANIITRKK